MKAFLLAAGLGTRLRPLTDSIPKCLAPIRGEPLLGIWLRLLRRDGVDEVLVNAHVHTEAVRKYIAAHGNGLSIKVIEEATLLGSAGTIAANRDWVRSEPFFWVCYADVLTNMRLDEMLSFHQTRGGIATLGVYEPAHPERCGITVIDPDGRIVDFVEKPETPPSRLAFSGVLIGTPGLLDLLPTKVPADLGFDVLPKLIGKMFAFPTRDYLLDIGTLENYRIAQKTWPGLATQK